MFFWQIEWRKLLQFSQVQSASDRQLCVKLQFPFGNYDVLIHLKTSAAQEMNE